MRFDLENLPTDATMLHHLVRDMADDIAQRDDQIERLKLIIRKLQRVQYGARSERLSEDQLALGLEDHAIDAELAAVSAPAPTPKEQPAAATPRRKALPEHLPRVDRCVDLKTSTCDCCGGELHTIGEHHR
jgi:transposase